MNCSPDCSTAAIEGFTVLQYHPEMWDFGSSAQRSISSAVCPAVCAGVQGCRTNIPPHSSTSHTKGKLNTFKKLWMRFKRGFGCQEQYKITVWLPFLQLTKYPLMWLSLAASSSLSGCVKKTSPAWAAQGWLLPRFIRSRLQGLLVSKDPKFALVLWGRPSGMAWHLESLVVQNGDPTNSLLLACMLRRQILHLPGGTGRRTCFMPLTPCQVVAGIH